MMLLRARIAAIVIASFALLTAGLLLEGLRQQNAVEARHAAAVVTGDRNAWLGLLAAEAQRLGGLTVPLLRDEGFVLAMAAADQAALAAALDRLLSPALTDPTAPVGVEVSNAAGMRLHASAPGPDGGSPPGALSLPVLARLLGTTSTVAGLVATPGAPLPAIAAIAPVYGRRGLTGYVALHVSLQPTLTQLARTIGAEVLLRPVLAEGGGATKATDAAASGDERALLADRAAPEQASGLARVTTADGKRTLLRVHIPVEDRFQRPAGTLVSLRDVTAADREERLVRMLSYGALGSALLLLVGFLYWYLRMAFRPLNSVIGILAALARGRPAPAVEGPFGTDEIGSLASTVEAFRQARQALVDARAAQARIDSELAVARRIQLDIVPSASLPPEDLGNVQLAAVLEPAKEVGGDLYDFFLLEDGRLFFIVGDVAGKGVPSALIMVIVRTLVRVAARKGRPSLPDILAAANRHLAENNPQQMFVTAFAGILDHATGVVTCCDAGHPPPLIRRRDGRVEELVKSCGLPLGILPDYDFTPTRLQLEPGDTLVVYSDGVSEAMNEEQALFSTERMETRLAELPPEAGAADVTRTLLEGVRDFAGKEPQSDDITLLVLRWLGPAAQHRLRAA